jgi:cytoskeletal protein CcmA (bactofilin family)
VQGETSEIVGAVTAESARLAGIVRGSISARELVILRSARIHGDVHYDALTIEQGAQVDGRFAPRDAPLELTVESGDGHLTLASSNT